jgi:hypothetical protein
VYQHPKPIPTSNHPPSTQYPEREKQREAERKAFDCQRLDHVAPQVRDEVKRILPVEDVCFL